MSATVLCFPLAGRAPDDVSAAARHLRRASSLFENAEASADPDRAMSIAAEDAEAFLFHILTHLGCREDDRELRNILARREARRHAK